MNAAGHNEPNTFRLFNGKGILKQRKCRNLVILKCTLLKQSLLMVQLLFLVDVKQAAADNSHLNLCSFVLFHFPLHK